MPFDFKKEEKALYQPGKRPAVIVVPTMNYLAVRGHGDPNEAGGDCQQAIAILYAVAYTIKMSKKGVAQNPRLLRLRRPASGRLLVARRCEGCGM